MRSYLLLFLLCIGIACQKEDVQILEQHTDITLEDFNYFGRDMPNHMYRGLRMKDDTSTNQLAALGRILFYDPYLSKNNSISCANCHQQSKAFADGLALSSGLFGEQTTRSSMALINLGFQHNFFWDFSGENLEKQVMKPIKNHIEMGIENVETLSQKLQSTTYYPKLFQEVFDTSSIADENIYAAIAAFV